MKAIRINVNDGDLPTDDEQNQICYWKSPSSGTWFIWIPKKFFGNLSKHDIVENSDGTITVSPSILITRYDGVCHGFLENGEWRYC